MRSVGILSLGCKVNMYESEFITNKLSDNGYIIKDFNDICDVYIINTCTVTNTSDIKSRKMIRKAIRNNPDACIVAMGCFIQANPDLKIEGIDILIGNKDKSKIVEILDEYFSKRNEIRDLYQEDLIEFEDMYIDKFPGRTRAFVKIQDGCENYCSYCIIPYVRGKCRSKDKSTVIKEITDLVNNGYKEIVLTGIHTGNYGVDLDIKFSDLLKEIITIPNLERLRISSIEITELTDEVLDVIKSSNIIVNHLHIPLQAGSDKVLKLMNRKYDLNYYFDKINKIRLIRPDISISTDIIVGFPGEDEIDFNNTLETSKKIGFSKIHVFPFSERKNTKAASMPNKVDQTIIKTRAKKLLELSKKLEIEYAKKFINKELEVLIEEHKEGFSYGHTSNFLHVKIEREIPKNTIIKIKIIKEEYPYLIGE